MPDSREVWCCCCCSFDTIAAPGGGQLRCGLPIFLSTMPWSGPLDCNLLFYFFPKGIPAGSQQHLCLLLGFKRINTHNAHNGRWMVIMSLSFNYGQPKPDFPCNNAVPPKQPLLYPLWDKRPRWPFIHTWKIQHFLLNELKFNIWKQIMWDSCHPLPWAVRRFRDTALLGVTLEKKITRGWWYLYNRQNTSFFIKAFISICMNDFQIQIFSVN